MKRPSKTRKSKSKLQRPSARLRRRIPDTPFIEFPQVQGRIIKKLQVFTTADHHSITIDFRDGISLVLNIEPCFLLEPSLRLVKQGNEEVTQTWPPFRNATEIS